MGSSAWYEPELIDAELSEEGIEQCLQSETKNILANMTFKCVVVSPMRRAIQTAHYLLRDRPDYADILFLINPLCREHLHTSGDIPQSYTEMVAYAQSLFPRVDVTSCFEHYEAVETYYIEDMSQDDRVRQKLKAAIENGA